MKMKRMTGIKRLNYPGFHQDKGSVFSIKNLL